MNLRLLKNVSYADRENILEVMRTGESDCVHDLQECNHQDLALGILKKAFH